MIFSFKECVGPGFPFMTSGVKGESQFTWKEIATVQ